MPLPYTLSWYLDVVSSGWEALVSDKYEYVMPLPVKRKYMLKYLIQPRWVQQLGIFSANEITAEVVRIFVRHIPYWFYDFNINSLNHGISDRIRTNMIIDCLCGIDKVRHGYQKNTVRNITKARSCGLDILEIGVDEFVSLWLSENIDKTEDQRDMLLPLVRAAMDVGVGKLLCVKRQGRIIAGLFGLVVGGRFTYLAPVSDREGKECRAMFLLVDYVLDEICCRNSLIFDCEGSMIEGVARFYKGFGAENESYYRISRGRPIWLFG